MTDDEVKEIAVWLEPGLRDWLSERLTELGVDPLDGVRVMVVMVDLLREHFEWLQAHLN